MDSKDLPSDSPGVSRSGRIRKKSSKLTDFLESAEEATSPSKKKSPPKSPSKVTKAESSTSDSTSSSSDDSEVSDSSDFGEDGDLKAGFLNWNEDLEVSNTPSDTKDDPEEGTLQVDEDVGRRRRSNYSQAQSLYLSEKKKQQAKPAYGKQKKADRKDKGKPKITAYVLWAKETRSEIMEAFPDMDFPSVNKRLGEMWGCLTNSQKMMWKRKAKKLSNKLEKSQGGAMISTGKPKGTTAPKGRIKRTQGVGRPPKQVEHKVIPAPHSSEAGHSPLKPILQTPKSSKTSPSIIGDTSPPNLFKVAGTSPIDVAAHLKLLGESLNNIGQKLKEHEGQIAVSGSLSVLLDSMLCVLGPLACLTNQLEETQSAISDETLNNILDNIAYIMPGIV